MKNKPGLIIRLATAVCVAAVFTLSFSGRVNSGVSGGNMPYMAAPGNGCCAPGELEWEGCGCLPPNPGGGGGGGSQPPPDIWDQDLPDADGVYTGHPPDKDGIIQPGDLIPDLCEWIYGYHCASVGRDYTLKQDWTEDPQSGELYDPYVHNAPGQAWQLQETDAMVDY